MNQGPEDPTVDLGAETVVPVRETAHVRTQSPRKSLSPHFSRPVRNAHRVPTFVGASRESFRPGKLLPKQLATVRLGVQDLRRSKQISRRLPAALRASRRQSRKSPRFVRPDPKRGRLGIIML